MPELSNADILATAIELQAQGRYLDMELREITALLRLGAPLTDKRFQVTVTYDKSWLRSAEAAAGRPTTWLADYRTLVPAPAYTNTGYVALEIGPDDTCRTVTESLYGLLGDLTDQLGAIDLTSIDQDFGVAVEICGWALWLEGHFA